MNITQFKTTKQHDGINKRKIETTTLPKHNCYKSAKISNRCGICVPEIIDDILRIVVAVAEKDPPIPWPVVSDVREFELKDFWDMPHALYMFQRKIDASPQDSVEDLQHALIRMTWTMEIRRLNDMDPLDRSFEFKRLCKMCE